jgi:hypothetical protein
MPTSINRRIKDAEKRLQEFKRTQSFEGYVAITGQNVVLPDAVKSEEGAGTPGVANSPPFTTQTEALS